EDALSGAKDIIAELISDNPEYREWIREMVKVQGLIVSQATKDAEESVFEQYYDYSEAVKSIPDHRILAINRGENEKILRVKVTMPDEAILDRLCKTVITNAQSIFAEEIESAIQDAY
ncbi:RNA-binding transcriptional accessory protein, partial [Aduncisulcus paluster]